MGKGYMIYDMGLNHHAMMHANYTMYCTPIQSVHKGYWGGGDDYLCNFSIVFDTESHILKPFKGFCIHTRAYHSIWYKQ